MNNATWMTETLTARTNENMEAARVTVSYCFQRYEQATAKGDWRTAKAMYRMATKARAYVRKMEARLAS